MGHFGKRSLLLLLALVANAESAQEVVLTSGERINGTVQKYENGLALIRMLRDDGSTMLTSLPESAIDKVATEEAQRPSQPEPELTMEEEGLPESPLAESDDQPGLTTLASQERARKLLLRETGTKPVRVLTDDDVGHSIPTAEEVETIADLGEGPPMTSANDQGATTDGMKFYEERLNTLASAFTSLGEEWQNMSLQCSPVTYDETSQHSGTAYGTREGTTAGGYATKTGEAGVYAGAYRENVYQSYRGTTYKSGTIDRWTPACASKHESILARGRQIVEAYDAVYRAYRSHAVSTLQVSRMVRRQLPSHLK